MKGNLKKFLILLSPSRAFEAKAKARFLAAFDARHGIPSAQPVVRLGFVFKATAGLAALLMVLFGSVSVYADTANVPADSVLYPWKRLTESVQLAVTPASQKAELQATLAARRVAEIDDLETRQPTSTVLVNLQSDANAAVNASIVSAARSNLTDGALTNLCGKLLSTVATSSAIFRGDLEDQNDLLERFTDRCERASGGDRGRFPFLGSPVFTSATTIATTSVSSTIEATGTVSSTVSSTIPIRGERRGRSEDRGSVPAAGNLENRIKNYLDSYFKPDHGSSEGESGTGATSTTSTTAGMVITAPQNATTAPTSTGGFGGGLQKLFDWWHGGNGNNGDTGDTGDGKSGQGSIEVNGGSENGHSGGDQGSATTSVNFDSTSGHLLQSNGDN